MYLIVKKLLKLDKKIKKKTYDSIDKKLPKFNEETRKKTDHLYHIYCFIKSEKSSNFS